MQKIFYLSRNNNVKYHAVDKTVEFEEGVYYTLNAQGKYIEERLTEVPSDWGTVTYYRSVLLNDILWIDYTDTDLTVEYKYDGKTLLQSHNSLTYNGTDYAFETTTYIDNIYARIFSYIPTGETEKSYIALTVNENGEKVLYNVTESDGIYSKTSPVDEFGALTSITFKYEGFGTLDMDTGLVDTVQYGAEFVFGRNIIINSNIYNINVKPYIIAPTENEIDSGRSYTLHNSKKSEYENREDDLFITHNNDNVTGISFGTSDMYEISESEKGVKKITFKHNGNRYNVDMSVTINYRNGKSYDYIVTFNVKNTVRVNIAYPYYVDKEDNEYQFTEEIDVLTKSLVIGETIDDIKKDYAEWLGLTNGAKVPYDLALVGDTINLTTDSLRDFSRYSSGILTIGTIQLVAVSSNYANNDYISAYLTCENGSIKFGNINNSGYMLFRVYAEGSGEIKDGNEIQYTGAYGYYLVRLTSDTRFKNVLTIDGRNEGLKPITASSGVEIYKAITQPDIAQISGSIDKSLINSDLSNVKLLTFAVL